MLARCTHVLLPALLVTLARSTRLAADPLPRQRPDALGVSSARLARIGQVLERDIAQGRHARRGGGHRPAGQADLLRDLRVSGPAGRDQDAEGRCVLHRVDDQATDRRGDDDPAGRRAIAPGRTGQQVPAAAWVRCGWRRLPVRHHRRHRAPAEKPQTPSRPGCRSASRI